MMENPGSLIHRARQKIRIKPAPQPTSLQPEPQPEASQEAPQFVSRHASYSALMRSHDRISTRHIQDNR